MILWAWEPFNCFNIFEVLLILILLSGNSSLLPTRPPSYSCPIVFTRECHYISSCSCAWDYSMTSRKNIVDSSYIADRLQFSGNIKAWCAKRQATVNAACVAVVYFRRALRCAQAPKAWKKRCTSARPSGRSASYEESTNHCRRANGIGVFRIISQTHLLHAIRPLEDKRQSGTLITLHTKVLI